MEVEVAFRRRPYRGKPTGVRERFRLVGIRDPETQAHYCFLTSLTPEPLRAEDVAAVYRARWVGELLFKGLNRLYQFDVIARAAPMIIEALVLTALLTLGGESSHLPPSPGVDVSGDRAADHAAPVGGGVRRAGGFVTPARA